MSMHTFLPYLAGGTSFIPENSQHFSLFYLMSEAMLINAQVYYEAQCFFVNLQEPAERSLLPTWLEVSILQLHKASASACLVSLEQDQFPAFSKCD
ncbi:hypothetical protein M1N58_02405 [Dehalococcoidales bacterium]|nr:hypothetical protein [Dehalococcoidales bacterium]